MAQSLNNTLTDTSNAISIAYDTEVPELIDPANIIEAFAFYHYGGNYDGVGNPEGIAGHFNTVTTNIENHKASTGNTHGLGPTDGVIVGTSASQNLSNKTYITPTIVGTTTISGSTSISTNLTVGGNLAVDTNTLFVDSANNRVGVGTATPTTALDVINPSDAVLGAIKIRGSESDTRDPKIQFANNAGTERGHIRVLSDNDMLFNVGGNDRLRIDSATGILTVTNPSTFETGARNITVSNALPTSGQGSNGDLWIVYTA